MIEIIRQWRPAFHSSVLINRNLKLDNLLYADDQVILADS
jgi:hypothetical protein